MTLKRLGILRYDNIYCHSHDVLIRSFDVLDLHRYNSTVKVLLVLQMLSLDPFMENLYLFIGRDTEPLHRPVQSKLILVSPETIVNR